MKRFATADGRLGLICILLAVVALVAWVPLDIETGVVEKLRRRVTIGDAMLPALALGCILLGGVITVFAQQREAPSLSLGNLTFLFKIILVLAVSFAIMRWLGPLVVEIAGSDLDYRVLRDTIPWKYVGFLVGGTAFVTGLMAVTEGRLTPRAVLVGLCAAIALIIIYDLPFEDLLLPPNGDV